MSDTPRLPGQRRTPERRAIDLAKAVNLALAGATFRQIATEVEADEDTVRHHLTSPEGQRALRYAVNDLQERTDRFLASAHLQALRRLVREMEDADRPSDRIRAAQAIVSLATRRIEVTGADGAPIAVEGSVSAVLDERINRMRERSRQVIDAVEVPTVAVDVAEVAEELEAAALPIAEGPLIVEDPGDETRAVAEEPRPPSVADRRRAGPRLPPGGRLRAL